MCVCASVLQVNMCGRFHIAYICECVCVCVQDFVVSVVLTLLWLISSSAWAAGLADVKEYTDPAEGGFFDVDRFPECKDASKDCRVLSVGNYGSLNASVVSGASLCPVIV